MSQSIPVSESVSALLIESSPDGILAFDRECRYTIWNPVMEQLSGMPREQVLGRCAFDVFPFIHESGEARFFYAALAGESLETHDQPYAVPATGKKGYCEGRYAPLRDAQGHIVGGMAIIHDVTARKHAEMQTQNEAEAAERRFRTTFEQSPLSMQILTPDGWTIRVNQAFEEMWGITFDDLTNYNVLADPQLEEKGLLPYLKQGFAGEPTIIPAILYNTRQTLHTGLARWVQGFIYPLKDERGEITEVVLLHEDVSDRKAIEELNQFLGETGTALVSSLDYETTLQTVAKLVVPFLADWCIIDVVEGDAFRRVAVSAHDAAKEEILLELKRRYPPNWESPRPTTQALKEGHLVHLERAETESMIQMIQDPHHQELIRKLNPHATLAIPLIARNRVVGVLTLTMSESGRLYRATERALAEEVARRAALAIDNARLYQAIEETSRMKDQFLAVLSHELRTPLTAIVGWSNLLRMGRLPAEETQMAIDSIDRNAKAQTQLVEDLLEVSRIVTGKFHLTPAECDLSAITKTALTTLLPAADEKKLDLRFICASACPVEGDPTRLQQVALNLLANAIKFTPEGGRIEVEVQANDSTVELRVSDSGQGISADFLPHVFDRFRQSDSTTTREFGGLGLGLSIVKHIVDLHRGAIEAVSEGKDKGATFTVTLPRATS